MAKTSKLIFAIGGSLILAGLVLLGVMLISQHTAQAQNTKTLAAMDAVLTDRREGVRDGNRQAEMPVLELGGSDYVALIEIPAYGLRLPVRSTWDKQAVMLSPCRFYGSAYNDTLVIGGSDSRGQFDFFDRIEDGTAVTVTDMTGSVFTYEVARVRRSDSARAEVLLQSDAHLTLFVRDARLLEYIILCCVVK